MELKNIKTKHHGTEKYQKLNTGTEKYQKLNTMELKNIKN